MFFKLFLALVPLMVVTDLLWIGVVMKDFYRGNLGHLMATSVNWIPAVFFYLIFITGLLYFVALPGIASGSFMRTALMGAGFGLVAYATYDLTNHATMKDWPLMVTLVDILWGACISGALAAAAFFLARWFS